MIQKYCFDNLKISNWTMHWPILRDVGPTERNLTDQQTDCPCQFYLGLGSATSRRWLGVRAGLSALSYYDVPWIATVQVYIALYNYVPSIIWPILFSLPSLTELCTHKCNLLLGIWYIRSRNSGMVLVFNIHCKYYKRHFIIIGWKLALPIFANQTTMFFIPYIWNVVG